MRGAVRRGDRRRRNADGSSPERQYLVIGEIMAGRGLQGELKVRIETDDPGRFEALKTVYLGPDRHPYGVEGARLHRGAALLRLRGVADRDAADALRGLAVFVDVEDAPPLAEGEYYHHQIVGLQVVSEAGDDLGRITEVLVTGANDVYVVAGPGGELLLPAIKDVVLRIDIPGGAMTVRVPEGLS